MSLVADLEVARGAFVLDAKFELASGEVLALVGPNGAGKSTVLRTLAGLERLRRGTLSLDTRILDDGRKASFVAPEARRVGMVFQDHRLFPALDVLENAAFGLRARGMGRRQARELARPWLERVGMAEIEAARPRELSGGQAQRVALVRALCIEPRMLLLDEPLSAIDASGRLAFRRLLNGFLRAFDGVSVLVAHDIEDAVALADRIAVMEEGCVVQCGTVEEVVARPASLYASDLVGQNYLRGRCHGGLVQLGDATLKVVSELEGEVALTIHPRAVSLHREEPHGSPRNSWKASVLAVEPSLDRYRVRLGDPLPIVAEVTRETVREFDLRAGQPLWVAVKATEIVVRPS